MITKKHLTNTGKSTGKSTGKHSHDNKKHKYYIVHCNNNYKNDLNGHYLEKYLEKLGVMPDTNAITIIKKLDKNYYKLINRPFDKYCEFIKTVKLPKFNTNIVNADIFMLDLKSDINKRFYNYPKYLSNTFNQDYILKIINKYNIMKEITKELIKEKENKNTNNLDLVPETFKINELKKYKFPKWYILRPIDSFGGADILYINSDEELKDALKYYKTTKNFRGNLYENDVIATDYITNPLLFNKKKFHLRLYFLVSMTNNIFNIFLIKFGKILTAKLPFDIKKPFSKDKHDSHLYLSERDYFFPKDFNSKNIGIDINKKILDNLWEKIEDTCKILTRIFEKNKNKFLYINEKNAFSIFGLDIMIRENMTLAFIELNEYPGFNTIDPKKLDNLSKIIYGWINETVLEPLLKYNDPMIARKHQTYIKI